MFLRLIKSVHVGLRGGLDCLLAYYREAYDPVRQDRLTGVYNRREFDRRIGEAGSSCLILIDLDDFKRINDRHGHAVGDAVLQAVAGRIRRDSGDRVFRIGGEEFAVVVRASLAEAAGVAERLRCSIHDLSLPDSIRITISVGVGQLTGGETVDQCFSRVDRALYQAKRAGKDRVVRAVVPVA